MLFRGTVMAHLLPQNTREAGSNDGQTIVDVENVTGDEFGLIGCDVEDAVGHFLG